MDREVFEDFKNQFDSGLEDINQSYLRKREKNMYRCSMECFNNESFTTQDIKRCIDGCGKDVESDQRIIFDELELFETKLRKCIEKCDYVPQYNLKNNTMIKNVDFSRDTNMNCTTNCVMKYITLLPSLFDRIKNKLKSQNE